MANKAEREREIDVCSTAFGVLIKLKPQEMEIINQVSS